ncbi:glycosyltransferase family 1 protein [Mycena pura]|uniref:sterol 3beta-glucosyltransferase n=1 Tax=Mycena pura TaxID=153505 RepID=A0AAD6YEC3_9AGAR|nr:glycosyltransferase family 1 protein [Mycena pura]
MSATPPTRADTASSDDSDTGSDPVTSGSDPITSVDHFYSEACAFEKILANNGFIENRRDSVNGFDQLVGKHLTPEEASIACRAAKLAATGSAPSWTPSSILEEEPESYLESEEPDETLDTDESSTLCDIPQPVLNRTATLDSDAWKLEPDEIIRMLIDEFGALAPDGEEEKLLVETDGGFVKDIAIIGVIHLTTHRLTFHASLMATSPAAHKVLRAGPVVMHRKGWRSKRRLWMELSPDMLCSYASSKDMDRLKPTRTVLLSSIRQIIPVDPKQPRYLRIIFEKHLKSESYPGIAEFDTDEAALDWRREIAGAVFLYRHRRREALGTDTESGVRFSCPLARIQSAEFLDPATGLATLQTKSPFRDSPRTIRLGPVYQFPAWQKLPDILAHYKKRREVHPSKLDETPMFVDLGPITISEVLPDVEITNYKEKVVRNELALGAEPNLWMAKARLYRTVASGGIFVVTDHYIGFWCKFLTQPDARYRLHVSDVREAKPFHSTLRSCSFGLALEIEGNPDVRFQFRTEQLRAEAMNRVNASIRREAQLLSDESKPSTPLSIPPPSRSATGVFSPLERSLAAVIAGGLTKEMQASLPIAINLPQQVLVKRAPKHYVCLTIGSRGDVQPYIALGLGLIKEGHTVTIVTHEEYKPWIESFGIKHKQAGGDPGALMKLSVENKMFSPDFFKESIHNFRPWLDQCMSFQQCVVNLRLTFSVLLDSWESCQGADILLESPSAMSGVHIAEALNIPYFRTFTMPWTKTSEFPHAFLSPPMDSPTFNSASNVMWTATSGQINRWRRNVLKIGNTDMGHLAQSKIAFIYNFSTAVVPKPLDWGDAITISGYWFLDNPEGFDWIPPPELVEWMAKARKDGKPLVYIGFGSITVPHPNKVTARIVKAVLKSGVRAIISKGWSARMNKGVDKDPEVEMPPECYQVSSIPHDWLFKQIDCALHHGGAGTTGASLRAGIPTLIKPWFGDQFFWASRVQKLGAGLRVHSMHSNDLADALIKATTSRIMKEKAAAVGEKIRAEDGVHTAIHTIDTYLGHATSYIEKIRSHS